MAGQLETSLSSWPPSDPLRRFIADASHELRTPITALKNFNELLLGAAADDAEARREFLAESQVQIERLEWITHNLLDLSRLDAGLAQLEIGWFDLGELIAAAAEPFKARAVESGLELALVSPGSPLEIACDRARFDIALSNLLDNALKFTPPGGNVDLRAGPAAGGIRIQVCDTELDRGGDLPQSSSVFTGKGDHPRSGSGLGLSIAEHRPGARRMITVASRPAKELLHDHLAGMEKVRSEA
jgi:signal transduction histidine kinase